MGNQLSTISICSLKHRYVWRLTSNLMIENIEAKTFNLFVPEDEILEFKRITPREFSIYPQEDLGRPYLEELRIQVQRKDNYSRFGWYAQQFHKIQALQKLKSKELVIWDADCVPTRRIELFSGGIPIYMKASESNADYFEAISKLLWMQKVVQHSFVIPGFPIKSDWVSEFIGYIEELHKVPWFSAIIKTTDFAKRSGFSETETLGTWLTNKHFDELIFQDLKWERSGQSRFGYAKHLTVSHLRELGSSFDLDIVSFENWDLRGWKRTRESILRHFFK